MAQGLRENGNRKLQTETGARKIIVRILASPIHYHFMEHISDHDLERYYLGMVPHDTDEESAIEEHLLGCHQCVERAEASDSYVDTIRAAIITGDFDLEFESRKKGDRPPLSR